MYSYLRRKCLLSENGALDALFMGLFTLMDRWSVCISCINITYTHTHRHIPRLGGQPAVFTVGTPREAYIKIIHLFNIDQYTVCNEIMPTLFLPLAAASVLDVAGVLAVVVLLHLSAFAVPNFCRHPCCC
jgi:hypothetical protein